MLMEHIDRWQHIHLPRDTWPSIDPQIQSHTRPELAEPCVPPQQARGCNPIVPFLLKQIVLKIKDTGPGVLDV
jgi:hypothetical protein